MSLLDAHFFALPSQPNIYTLARLTTSETKNRLLVGSLQRKLYSFEYANHSLSKGGYGVVPSAKEVPFTYIPSGSEIISVDAFTKSSCEYVVIGITIVKSNDIETNHYLNIYSGWEEEPKFTPPNSETVPTEFNLELVAQSCLSLSLDFVPYHLYHAKTAPEKETVWLLSGSDRLIHIYREDRQNHRYHESSATLALFPEFLYEFPSVVLRMHIVMDDDGRRLTAVGSECGLVRVTCTIIAGDSATVTATWEVQNAGPVSSLCFFRHKLGAPYDLVVGNTLEPCAVYKNVAVNGLDDVALLENSDGYDAVLCCVVADVNMDGTSQILLGTYGQELLVYTRLDDDTWRLSWQCSFSSAILGIDYVDVTSDGAKELVVMTAKGLHVLQHDPKELCKIIEKCLSHTLESTVK